MRIIENRTGSEITYSFNPGYDTKVFYQKIEIENPGTQIKMIHMFNKNLSLFEHEDYNLNGVEQYVKIDWGDGSPLFKTIGTVLVNDGIYNTENGLVIDHTFNTPGVYVIKITSVSDLIAVNYDYNINESIIPCEHITLRTIEMGGKVNRYIPPNGNLFSNVITKLDEISSDIKKELLEKKIRYEFGGDKMYMMPSSWNISVNRMDDLLEPITFKYETMNDFSFMFSRWFVDSVEMTDDASINVLDDTLYDLFRKKNYSLFLTGMFAHSKGFIQVIKNGNIGQLLKEYSFDFSDYVEDTSLVRSYQFILWNIQVTNTNLSLDIFKDNLKFYGINKSLKLYPDMLKGAFGLLPKCKISKLFNFGMLLSKSHEDGLDEGIIHNTIDLSYFMFNSPFSLGVTYDMESMKFFSDITPTWNIVLKRAFMYVGDSTVMSNVELEKERIEYTVGKNFSFVPMPGIKNLLIGRCGSVNIDATSMFKHFNDYTLMRDIDKQYELSTPLSTESNVSIINNSEVIDSLNNNTDKVNYMMNLSEFMGMMPGNIHLNSFYRDTKCYWKLFSEDRTKYTYGNVEVTVNQDYTSMFAIKFLSLCKNPRLIEKANPYVELDSNKFKIYLDYEVKINTKKFTEVINYSKLFECISINDISYTNPGRVLCEIGHDFYDSIDDENKVGYVKDKFSGSVDITSIASNSDNVTKEMVLNNFSTRREMNSESTVVDKLTQFTLITSNFEPRRIICARHAFSNHELTIQASSEGGSRESIGDNYRIDANYRVNRPNGFDRYLGLKIPSSFLCSEVNFGNKADLTAMFYNNLDIEIDHIYPLNDVFRIDLGYHSSYSNMFGVSKNIGFFKDKENGFKYSEFKNTNDKDEYIKRRAKYALVFDNFEIFSVRNLGSLSKFSLLEVFKNEIYESMFANRIVLTNSIQMLLMLYNNAEHSMTYHINSESLEGSGIKERLHTLIPTDIAREIDNHFGCLNIARGDDTFEYDYKDVRIDELLTPGYTMNVFNLYGTNRAGKELKIAYRSNIQSVKDITDNPDILSNICNSFVTNYGERCSIKNIIETTGLGSKVYEYTNQTAGLEGYKTLLTEKAKIVSGIKVLHSDIAVITRVFSKLNNGVEVFPLVELSDSSLHLDSTIMTPEIVTKDFNNTISEISNVITNIEFLNSKSYSYVGSYVGYIVYELLRIGNKKKVLLGKKFINENKFISYRDSLKMLYNATIMNNSEIEYEIEQSSDMNVSMVEVVRENDLQFVSHFDIAKNIDFGSNNVKVVDAYGLIHCDHIKARLNLSRNKEIYNFGSSKSKPNLKFILGTLVNPMSNPLDIVTDTTNSASSVSSLVLCNTLSYSNEPKVLSYIDPLFLSNLSNINSNTGIVTIISIHKLLNKILPKNLSVLSKTLSSNIYYTYSDICTDVFALPEFTRPANMDGYQTEDIVIKISNKIPDIKTPEYQYIKNENKFSNMLFKPNVLSGDACTKILIVPFRHRSVYNTREFRIQRLSDMMSYDNFISTGNHLFIQVLNEKLSNDTDYNTNSFKFIGNLLVNQVNYNVDESYARTLVNELSNNMIEFIDVNQPASLTTRAVNEYTYHYMNKLLFNKLSEKTISMKDIIKMIFNNGVSYGIHIAGLMINSDCTLKYTLNDEVITVDYKEGQVLDLNVTDNLGKVIKNVSNITIENGRTDIHICVDIKIGILSSLIIPNSNMFQPRLFVKDNRNNWFEMQRLFFKKKTDVVGNWNINISKSNLTRDGVTYADIIDASSYNGDIIFTDNMYDIKHVLERGYLNNNSLAFHIPENKDTFILYCINDTPFSCENSDGEVFKIEGPLVYDISKYIAVENGVLNLEYILRTLCNTLVVNEVDECLFENFNKDNSNLGTFAVSLGGFKILNFDLRILNAFSKNITGIKDTLNDEENFYTIKGYLTTINSFNISNSFNVKLSYVGMLLNEPFVKTSIESIVSSFNMSNNSINPLLPHNLLNSNQRGNMRITNSFNNTLILSPLRTTGINVNTTTSIECSSIMNNSIFEDFMTMYGKYIFNYLLNYRGSIAGMNIDDSFVLRTYETTDAILVNISEYVNSNLVAVDSDIDLEDISVHKKVYLNY